jgi:hypothetical protein
MGKMGVFAQMPRLSSILSYYLGVGSAFMSFAIPGMGGLEALDAIKKAADETMKALGEMMGCMQQLVAAGFPLMFAGGAEAPFDTLGDWLRGTRGLMIDMYRRPEKVLAVCGKLLPMMMEPAVMACKMSGDPRVFIPLHKGQEGFMSLEQFRKCYWPTLRQLLMAFSDAGLNPITLAKGTTLHVSTSSKTSPQGRSSIGSSMSTWLKRKRLYRKRSAS